MKIKAGQRISQINIKVAGEAAGVLVKKAQFQFSYHSDAQFPVAVSMPVEERYFQHGALFPIFEMNIPEGYIRHRITERLRKHVKIDEMLFLALQGNTGIGCITYEADGIARENLGAEKLAEILTWDGSDDLFEGLINKYLLQSNISGVQPKVMVPEEVHSVEKGAMVLPSLIVKSGDEEYPELAVNEFICMKLASACQISTPEFWLSDNHKLFVMRRFDLNANGTCIAMEDMAVMQGKSTNDKYESSYESIAKVLDLYSSDIITDKYNLFKMLVHSCMVGNGDAHLKNFAMLYNSPNDMRLSPLYDVVNTQIYHAEDRLALNLGKSKVFPDRKRIIGFGKLLGVKKCENIVDEIADQIRDELERLADYTEAMELNIKSAILKNIHRTVTRSSLKTSDARKYTKYS